MDNSIKVKVRTKPRQKINVKPLIVGLDTYDSDLLKIYLQAKEDVKNGESN